MLLSPFCCHDKKYGLILIIYEVSNTEILYYSMYRTYILLMALDLDCSILRA
jgi:DUF1365 family protein